MVNGKVLNIADHIKKKEYSQFTKASKDRVDKIRKNIERLKRLIARVSKPIQGDRL